jgi:hypothetical protein
MMRAEHPVPTTQAQAVQPDIDVRKVQHGR